MCAGQTLSLCAVSGVGYTYEWTTGENTQCISINTPGMYCVTVTNASGCTSFCSKTITLSGAINCSITGCSSNTICAGQTVSLCTIAGAGYSYEWTTGENTRCISVNSPGTYCVTVTNASGCSSVCSKTITLNGSINCTITGCDNNTICTGQTLSLCTIAGAGYTYEWTTGENTRCISINTPGTYCVTVTNASGCTSVCSKIIRLVNAPSCLISGNTPLSTGQTIQLCVPTGSASYLWSTGATTPCIAVSAIGTYAVTVTNANGCSSVCSVRVLSMSAYRDSVNTTSRGHLLISSGKLEAQSFPNPFVNKTTIEFRSHDSTAHLTVDVFNVQGIKVAKLFDGKVAAEEVQSVAFDAANLPEGFYIYRISSGESRLNGRIVLIKH